MTAREQEALLRRLYRAKDAIEAARDALDGFADGDAEDAIAAVVRIADAVERAR